MKVSELSGDLLDYWVARSNGYKAYIAKAGCFLGKEYRPICIYGPSTEWDQGGPIIERERIFSRFVEIGFLPMLFENKWVCHYKNGSEVSGDTQLIAAMRCFVASKFGLEVPDA